MDSQHTQMYRRLLESISYYSKKVLGILESGAGDLPQWTNHVISSTRTHMKDVTHFLRGQADHGVRYGGDPHGRAYMASKNLREISEYADEALGHMVEGAGHFPAWLENKVSVSAEYMDLIGHWLENEGVEGRKYGSYLNPVPGDAGDEALYRGRADGIGGVKRNPYSPNSFQHKIYEQGFEEGYGGSPRGYGARGGAGGGGGRGAGGGGPRGGGGGPRGPRGPGPGPRPGHRGPGRRPGPGPGMGRGRGRRRRHRRHGINVFPYWNVPYYYYPEAYPVYEEYPVVENVTAYWDGSDAVILLQGYNFNLIPGNTLLVRYEDGGSLGPNGYDQEILNRSDQSLEIRIKFIGGWPSKLNILGIYYPDPWGNPVSMVEPFSMAGKRFSQTSAAPGPKAAAPAPSSAPRLPPSRAPGPTSIPGPSVVPRDIPPTMIPHPSDVPPGVVYQPGYGSIMAQGAAPTAPLEPSKMEWMMPPNRMLEPHRMGILHRQLGHQTGRRFGWWDWRQEPHRLPPGWAGQAGVAQIPHPSRGGGPRAVQTYGSLGYASMGDGSMDMAVRGARFAQIGNSHQLEEIVTTGTRARSSKQVRRTRAKMRRRSIMR